MKTCHRLMLVPTKIITKNVVDRTKNVADRPDGQAYLLQPNLQ
jgi:hypothetical protein